MSFSHAGGRPRRRPRPCTRRSRLKIASSIWSRSMRNSARILATSISAKHIAKRNRNRGRYAHTSGRGNSKFQARDFPRVYRYFAYGFYDQQTPPQPITHGSVTFSEQFSNVVTAGQIKAPSPTTGATDQLSSDSVNDDMDGFWFPSPGQPKPGDSLSLTKTWSGAIGTGKMRPLATTSTMSYGDNSGTLYVTDTITTV